MIGFLRAVIWPRSAVQQGEARGCAGCAIGLIAVIGAAGVFAGAVAFDGGAVGPVTQAVLWPLLAWLTWGLLRSAWLISTSPSLDDSEG